MKDGLLTAVAVVAAFAGVAVAGSAVIVGVVDTAGAGSHDVVPKNWS